MYCFSLQPQHSPSRPLDLKDLFLRAGAPSAWFHQRRKKKKLVTPDRHTLARFSLATQTSLSPAASEKERWPCPPLSLRPKSSLLSLVLVHLLVKLPSFILSRCRRQVPCQNFSTCDYRCDSLVHSYTGPLMSRMVNVRLKACMAASTANTIQVYSPIPESCWKIGTNQDCENIGAETPRMSCTGNAWASLMNQLGKKVRQRHRGAAPDNGRSS